jgi:hypothetical protein
MPDTGGAFQVSPEELVALAGSVSRIRDQLEGAADLVHDCTPALGSDVVAAALQHFVSGWRDGRKQICAEVEALADMLRQAATTYAATDGELSDAIPAVS